MKPLRTAVVGAGHLGRIHSRLMNQHQGSEIEFVAVVDPVAENRLSVAAENGVRAYSSHDDLLGQVDAAVVAAPTAQHHAIVCKLLRNGIHVLVEKPISLDTEQADEMVKLAQRSAAVLQVGHVERFNPAFVAASGKVSQPTFVEAVRCGTYTGRSTDVSVILDLMIHDIDLVLSWVKGEVHRIAARGGVVFGPHLDWAEAELTFANGETARLSASRVHPSVVRTLRAIDNRGWAWVDFQAKTAQWMTRGRSLHERTTEQGAMTPLEWTHVKERLFCDYLPLERLEVPTSNAIHDEQRDFFAAIRAQKAPRVDGRAGAEALRVAEQIHERIEIATEPRIIPLRKVA